MAGSMQEKIKTMIETRMQQNGYVGNSENKKQNLSNIRFDKKRPIHLSFERKKSEVLNSPTDAKESFERTEKIFYNDALNRNSIQENKIVSMILLLLGPTAKEFEFIEIKYPQKSFTIGDILDLIPTKSKIKFFRNQRYRGLCRPTNGIEIIDRSKTLTGPSRGESNKILNGEVLIALPNYNTGSKCMMLAQKILSQPNIAPFFRRSIITLKIKSSTRFIRTKHIFNRCETILEESNEKLLRRRLILNKLGNYSLRQRLSFLGN